MHILHNDEEYWLFILLLCFYLKDINPELYMWKSIFLINITGNFSDGYVVKNNLKFFWVDNLIYPFTF